jgi:hypothetical protein
MTRDQRELSQQLFGGPEQRPGAIGAIKDALLTVAPGLANLGRDIKAELAHQVGAGAHELAAALFNGNAFVMYQRRGHDDRPSQEQSLDAPDNQQDSPDQHLERGGRSM